MIAQDARILPAVLLMIAALLPMSSRAQPAAAGAPAKTAAASPSPHPNPLPKGEGTERNPLPEGEGMVGRQPSGRVVLPTSQVLTPLGTQVELPGMRPQVLALSPDGRLLAVSGKTAELVIVDPATGRITQRVALPVGRLGDSSPVSPQLQEAAAKRQASYTGLIFAPDGRRIYLSNVEGDVKVFAVDAQGTVTGAGSIPLPPAKAPRREAEIPAGLALSPDGRRLYVCGNLSNTLLELDAATVPGTVPGRVLRSFDVGVAPYDVVLTAGKALVSNWGGRRPGADDLTGHAGRGTRVRVDPVRHIASEGSVTLIDLDSGASQEVLTGLHACALAVSPDGQVRGLCECRQRQPERDRAARATDRGDDLGQAQAERALGRLAQRPGLLGRRTHALRGQRHAERRRRDRVRAGEEAVQAARAYPRGLVSGGPRPRRPAAPALRGQHQGPGTAAHGDYQG